MENEILVTISFPMMIQMDVKTKYKAKKTKIVFFDIDDTLRVKVTGYMPESIKYVFKSLKEKGIMTGIATGRALYGVVPEIRDLNPDYFVTINGTYVVDKKETEIVSDPLPRDLVEKYVNWAKSEGIEYGFTGKDKPVVSKRCDLIDDAMKPIYGICDVEPDFYLTNDVYQMWTFAENNADLQLPEDLASEIRLVPWHEHSSDVVKVNISKASGVAHVLESQNLKPINAMMFGDGPNDMEIFDYVGLKIAMGNAVPELKEKADFVTKTVANFVALSKDGYYDGIIFHRIIPEFMIQGGDPTGTGMGGQSIYGDSFEDEFSEELYNVRGALSMANAGPNTNGSQFFIVQNSKIPYAQKELERGGWPKPIAEYYANNGGTPHLDRRHTVFGQIMDEESYKVLDEIANVETGAQDRPVEDVVIETIEVVD